MEGKTTVACALATSMAQAGQRVLLVDCDLRRPRLHRIFKKGNDAGLTTALIGTHPPDALVQATEVENLFCVTAGPLPPNPAELLHSEAFHRWLEHATQSFDRVILDSPPLVPVTDGAVLATRVDGTVLVVRAHKTSRELARRGKKALTDVGASIVGVVLNAVDLRNKAYGHYHYDYYRAGAYGGDGDQAEG